MSHGCDSTPEKSRRKRDSNPGSSAPEADALTTRPTRRCGSRESKGMKAEDEGDREMDHVEIEERGSRDSCTCRRIVCLLIGCLTSQQQASVSQGRICTDNLTCCHTEIEAADQTFHLTQSQYTDTGPTSPSADPITPGAWQGSHWSANV